MNRILSASFFDRPTRIVARELLGKVIVVNLATSARTILIISEVEAYDGPHDKASHAHRGLTPRTRVMFGPAGSWYVYLVYGMHWMLNIVTGPTNYPAAILFRAGWTQNGEQLSGPARITRYLDITGALNDHAATRTNKAWIEDRGFIPRARSIHRAPRIGVDYAQEWKNKPYRFFTTDHP